MNMKHDFRKARLGKALSDTAIGLAPAGMTLSSGG